MQINKSLLIRLAGEGAYQRGVGVYKSNAVLSIKEKAGHIFAKVEGSEVYQVKLTITNQVFDGSCDCPASENFDFCKHCVATALAYKDMQADKIELENSDPLDRIQAYINQLSEQDTKTALLQLIGDDELLTNKWQLKADNASGSINIKQLKKQITKALPYRTYWEYDKVRHYFTNAEAALDPIFEILSDLDAEDAFLLAQYISQRLNKLLEKMDDSGGYRFSLEHQINETLTTAFKKLPWSANKKSQFLLAALVNEDEYMLYPEIPEDFLDSSTPEVSALFYKAIQDKWDALPNLHYGADYKEKRPYNNLLYILSNQADIEESIEKKITLKAKVAINVHDFIELAELNLAQEQNPEQMTEAECWLKKAQKHPENTRYSSQIKRLQISIFEAKQQPEKALKILWQIFANTQQFDDYQHLQQLTKKTEGNEIDCYQQAESILIKTSTDTERRSWHSNGYKLVDFYIKNKELKKAAEYAKNNNIDINQLQFIAKHITQSNVDLAFQFYQRIAMHYPQKSNNEAYQQTIDILLELKQGLPDEKDWNSQFINLLTEIKKTFKPKRNLMKLLAQNFG